ncbi:ribonuclease H-like domain-containing protein, partial [Lactifluus volemus]
IGPERISAVSSDDTGNTRKARRLYCTRYPHVLNMQDACHQIDKPIQQICKLDAFKDVIVTLRSTLAFMARSTYTMEHFNYERELLKIGRGLQSIGETRFGTIHWAAESLRRCLPALRNIVGDETLDIDINYFMSSTAQSIDLELSLTKLIAVIGPFAKAIQCLESPHTNPADVYLYWLAIVSQLTHLFSHNRVGLSAATMEDIRAITNKRFDQMINKSPNDVYITAFFLNP